MATWPVPFPGQEIRVYTLLQHGGSLAGVAALIVAYRSHWRINPWDSGRRGLAWLAATLGLAVTMALPIACWESTSATGTVNLYILLVRQIADLDQCVRGVGRVRRDDQRLARVARAHEALAVGALNPYADYISNRLGILAIALVSSLDRKRRQPGLTTDGPELVAGLQLVWGIQRAQVHFDFVSAACKHRRATVLDRKTAPRSREFRHQSSPHPEEKPQTHERAPRDACGNPSSDKCQPDMGAPTPRSGLCRTGNHR